MASVYKYKHTDTDIHTIGKMDIYYINTNIYFSYNWAWKFSFFSTLGNIGLVFYLSILGMAMDSLSRLINYK